MSRTRLRKSSSSSRSRSRSSSPTASGTPTATGRRLGTSAASPCPLPLARPATPSSCPDWSSGPCAAAGRPSSRPPAARNSAIDCSGISRKRTMWYGKKNVEVTWSMNTGRLPSSERTLVHTRPASAAVGMANRSHSSGCSLATWMQTLRITGAWSRTGAGPSPARRSRWGGRASGVVEVDDEPDPAPGHPDADAGTVVGRVHEVPVVAAVVRLLGLEEQVRAQDGGRCPAGATADVLRPPVAREAGPPEAVVGAAADEVAALVAGRQELGVGPGHLAADPGAQAQRGDVASAGRGAGAARGDPAARPGAVHEPQVVPLDGLPVAGHGPSAPRGDRGGGRGLGLGLHLDPVRLRRGLRDRRARTRAGLDGDGHRHGRVVRERPGRIEDEDLVVLAPGHLPGDPLP